MENFTPWSSTLGGVLIGVSAALMLLGVGRIAGISGIFGGMLMPKASDVWWRAAFVLGLLTGGAAMVYALPSAFAVTTDHSAVLVAIAGAVVGFGTRMGGGCTSGHGVCGIGRLSPRSLVATVTFILTGAVTVFLALHVFGASS